MARDHGRLLCRIWEDPEFRALSVNAQRLYMLLLSQPTLNFAGVIGVTLRRWARGCDETTTADVEKALGELGETRFVVIDEDTEELLVRSLIRNDGVADQPNVLKAALREARAVASPMLRAALAAELRRLPPQRPPRKDKMGREIVYPDPHGIADELDPRQPTEPLPKGSRNPSAKGSGTLPGTPAVHLDAKGSGNPSRTLRGPFGEPPGDGEGDNATSISDHHGI